MPISSQTLDPQLFKEYQNFWRLSDFLQSPHSIFSTAEPIRFEPLSLEALSPAPKRPDSRKDKGKVNKKVEDDVESGEIVEAGGAAIAENLDVHHIRRQVEGRSPNRLLEVLFQIEVTMNRFKDSQPVQEKDPKWSFLSYINKATSPSRAFSLFASQQADYFFRPRFVAKATIFLDCPLAPLKHR